MTLSSEPATSESESISFVSLASIGPLEIDPPGIIRG